MLSPPLDGRRPFRPTAQANAPPSQTGVLWSDAVGRGSAQTTSSVTVGPSAPAVHRVPHNNKMNGVRRRQSPSPPPPPSRTSDAPPPPPTSHQTPRMREQTRPFHYNSIVTGGKLVVGAVDIWGK